MANYIPFDVLDEALVKEIIDEGNCCIVIQRFAWPSFPISKSFMATEYKDVKLATEHFSQLKEKEGKLIQLDLGAANLINAINSKQFYFFFHMLKEENWEAKTLKAYKSNITSNLRSKALLRGVKNLDIEFYFVAGRLMAQVLIADNRIDLLAYDLLK